MGVSFFIILSLVSLAVIIWGIIDAAAYSVPRTNCFMV